MRCCYPNCRLPAIYTPVVEMPTIRTVGLIKPELSPLIHDREALRKGMFNRNMLIHQFESMTSEYKQNRNDMVYTDKPTYLICREVCTGHKETYNLFNWFRRSDWAVLREAARHYGVEIPDGHMVEIKFQPIGWRPQQGSLELDRDRMRTED